MTGSRQTVGLGTDFVATPDARRAEFRSYRGMRKIAARRVPQPPPGLEIPVVLVPGFISGAVSMTVIARRLRRAGHRTFGSGVGANLGCTDAMVRRVIAELERIVGAEGGPVGLVGRSRGGMIAKLVAARRPDLVANLVVLAAPVTGSLRVAGHVRAQLEFLFRLEARGWSRVIGADCVRGTCAAGVAAELDAPFPAGLPYTSVYSRSDAIIDWRCCLDPAAALVEVDCSHTGMSTDDAVHDVVVGALVPQNLT